MPGMPPNRKRVLEAITAVPALRRPDQLHPGEDEGEHRRGEDLEEALDPEVHDPPAPVLHDREVRAGAEEEAGPYMSPMAARAAGEHERPAARARRALPERRPDARAASGPARAPGRRKARSARRGPGRRTRSPGGRTRNPRRGRASGECTATRRRASRPRPRGARRTRTLTPRRWNRGSRPPTAGARKSPAASQAVAIQKIPSLDVPGAGERCRAGTVASGNPVERLPLDGVVRGHDAQQHLHHEERRHHAEVLGDGAHRRRRRAGRSAGRSAAAGVPAPARRRGRPPPDHGADAGQQQDDADDRTRGCWRPSAGCRRAARAASCWCRSPCCSAARWSPPSSSRRRSA